MYNVYKKYFPQITQTCCWSSWRQHSKSAANAPFCHFGRAKIGESFLNPNSLMGFRITGFLIKSRLQSVMKYTTKNWSYVLHKSHKSDINKDWSKIRYRVRERMIWERNCFYSHHQQTQRYLCIGAARKRDCWKKWLPNWGYWFRRCDGMAGSACHNCSQSGWSSMQSTSGNRESTRDYQPDACTGASGYNSICH